MAISSSCMKPFRNLNQAKMKLLIAYYLLCWAKAEAGIIPKNSGKIHDFLSHTIQQDFRRSNINLITDPGGLLLSEELISGISNGGSAYNTVSLNDGNTSRSRSTFQRFQDWSWINLLILGGEPRESRIFEMTEHIRTRATKYFFLDFLIIWQASKYNPDVLWLTALQKLKFKVELRPDVDPDSENIWLESICFYCNGGEASKVRQMIELKNILRAEELFPDYTKSFHGRRLRIAGGLGIPVLMDFRLKPDGSWNPFGGFMIDPILYHVQEAMNFTMAVSVFKTFGSQLPNGTFTGFVKELFHERADVGFAGQSYDRIQGVHFLDPIYIDSVSFATAVPESGFKWQAVFQAFTWRTWLLVLGTCFAGILPLYVLFGRARPGSDQALKKAFRRGVQFILRPMLDQDLLQSLIPETDSGRLLMIFWLITTLIVGVAYKSKLTSLMVYPEAGEVPNTFEVLAESKYRITLHHVGGALSRNIYSTPSDTFQRIGRRMELENSMFACLDRSRAGGRSCISYKCNIMGEIGRNFTDRNGKSALRMAPANVFMTAGSYMVPKSSLYKGTMGRIVSSQIGTGFAKYAVDRAFQLALDQGKGWARQRPDLFSWSEDGEGPARLTLNHVKAAFNLLLVGLGAGLICFGIEHCCYRKGRRSGLNNIQPNLNPISRVVWMRKANNLVNNSI